MHRRRLDHLQHASVPDQTANAGSESGANGLPLTLPDEISDDEISDEMFRLNRHSRNAVILYTFVNFVVGRPFRK